MLLQWKVVWPIKLWEDEYISSYYAKELFTSVPVDHAIKIIKEELKQDKELHQTTSMTVSNIINLLEFCLKNTNFVFHGRYYEQLEGAAMGFPISPIMANLFMENFGVKALITAANPQDCGEGMLILSWY